MGTTHNRPRLRLGALLAAALAVTACAGQGGGGDSDDSAQSGGTVTLTFWNGFTGPDRPALETLVKKFNQSQNDVQINMEITPWDVFFQKLLPSLGTGDGPDLMAMDTAQIGQYAARGVLASLDDFYGSNDVDRATLVPAAVNASSWQGKKYGVPLNFTTLLLYWNKDEFKAAGLDPEKPPTTWQEFASDAEKLTKDDNGDGKPEQYGLAIADHATIPMWPILFWGNGGGVVSDDGKQAILSDPATLDAAKYWTGLVKDKKISPVGLGGADADKLFQSNKAAMEIVGPWMTTGFKDAGIDFGLAMVPAGPKQQVTLGTSVAFSLNAKASKAERAAAYKFMASWNSKDSQKYWAIHSGFPPTRTDVGAAELSDNPYVAAFGQNAGKSRFYLTNVTEFQKVNETIFEPALQKVLTGKQSVDAAFSSADEQIQKVLDGSG